MLRVKQLLEKWKAEMPTQSTPSFTNEKYECSKCQDREFVIEEREGSVVAVECECRKQKRVQRLIKCSGLTELLKTKSIKNFQPTFGQEKMLEVAVEYIKNFQNIRNQTCNGLAYIGKVGNGKTHLLAAIANNLIQKGVQVLFVNTPELIAELRNNQFEDKEKMIQQLETIKSAEVVIFDDLAKEKPSEWVQTQYYRIINHRYINGLPTLFSSNCDFDILEDKLGDATTSRLLAMTKERLVYCDADDFRMVE